MAFATLNGIDIVSADLGLVRVGRWVMLVTLDTESADGLLGPVTVDIGGKLQLRGVASRGGSFAQRTRLRVVGGAAGLLKDLQPKAYQAVTLGLVLADALAEVGEALAPNSDPATLATPLPSWARLVGPCMAELEALLARAPAGTAWRINADGTVWVGPETWPAVEIDHDLLADLHWAGQAVIGVEVPSLQPGVTFLGRKVERVDHHIEADKIRTVATFVDPVADAGGEPNPTDDAGRLFSTVRRLLQPTRYARSYPARVVAQNGDGTLELKLDSATAPGLSRVPLRTFVPGAGIKVAPGSRVQVVFEEGDGRKSAAGWWEAGAGGLLELHIVASVAASLEAPSVRLGPAGAAIHPLVLGDLYRTAEAALNAAIASAHTAAAAHFTAAAAAWTVLSTNPAVFPDAAATGTSPTAQAAATTATAAAALATAAATAVGTMEAGAAGYLSPVSQTA